MKFLNLIFVSLLSASAFGQRYEEMPQAVRQQMDLNKEGGVDLYTKIQSTHTVQLEGLSAEESAAFLQEIRQDNRVLNVDLSSDRNTLRLTVKGAYTIKDVKQYVIRTSASIDSYSSTYFVN